VVVMANSVGGGSTVEQVLMHRLMDDLLGVLEKERFDWETNEEKTLRQGAYTLSHAREIAYPEVPDPPIPLTLPLSAYAGVYTHPAYPPLNLSITSRPRNEHQNTHVGNDEGREYLTTTLLFLNDDSISFSLRHISGEILLLYSKAFTEGSWNWEGGDEDLRPDQDKITKAEFVIGEDGDVSGIGVNKEPLMGNEKIWWRKEG